ncbi:MAG: endolytic transglycosylase MltG [Bacilli bacterium]
MAAKKNRRQWPVILGVVITIVLIIVGFGWWMTQPVDKNDDKKQAFTVPLGSSNTQIGQALEQEGLIRSATAFEWYIRLRVSEGLKAGNYSFSPSMTLSEIAYELQNGILMEEPAVKITIPEGANIEDVIKRIVEATNLKEDELRTFFADRDKVNEQIAKYPTIFSKKMIQKEVRYPLEGYLYPATYTYADENVTVEQLVAPMIKKTVDELTKLESRIKAKGWDVYDFLTFSSLIEEEATAKTDRAKIASVFYNRLEIDMPLQTDPTVLYALGRHKDRVLYEDLKIQSPYNTYVNRGLPVGPIANASAQSMEAALEPANTNYLYFLANKQGEVFFAETFEQHLALKKKHITNG